MLYKNDVFEMSGSGARWRLLAANPATDEAWIIKIEDALALPCLKQLSQLFAVATVVKSATVPIVHTRVSQRALSHRDAAWERIKPLVANPGIFQPEERSRLVRDHANSIGCSLQTLYTGLRKYWKGGQTKDALLPAFHKRGTKGGATAGRGRKSTVSGHAVFQAGAEDAKLIEKAIRKYYLVGEVSTMAAVYQRCLEDHYSYLDGNGARYIRPLGERPTLRQFRRILKQKFDLETTIRKRKGDKTFEQNHRARLGSVDQDCLGVGHIYEIDATIADVFLVSSRDRSRIIGKPTLYLIYDRRSRLVVGFYVGLEAPSWLAAMQAILSIAENKEALCHRFGVDYDPADWPADGVFPQAFLGDRGEMAAKNSNLLVAGLETTVINAVAMRPDQKGTVECGFKLIQRSMADAVPGYEPPENVFKRRGKAYFKDACLTLDEFTSLILANVIAHNYYEKYALRGKPSVETLLNHAARVLHVHFVGLLVVDEVQNLENSPKNKQALMSLLVSAANELGVSILFIGTNKARHVLTLDFRQARRATGHGQEYWDRLAKGSAERPDEWEDFINVLWRFQWLRKPVALNLHLSDLMYHHSQGVIDVAIKLFAAAQWRAMLDGSEQITAQLIDDCAKRELALVRPMIDAIRRNDAKALEAYDDVAPLNFERMLRDVQLQYEGKRQRGASIRPGDELFAPQLAASLAQLGLHAEDAIQLADHVEATGQATNLLEGCNQALKALKPPKAVRANKECAGEAEIYEFGDLRNAVQQAKANQTTIFEALKATRALCDLTKVLELS